MTSVQDTDHERGGENVSRYTFGSKAYNPAGRAYANIAAMCVCVRRSASVSAVMLSRKADIIISAVIISAVFQ